MPDIMTAKDTFCKEERLKSNLTIQGLLRNGKTVSEFPLKIYWDISSDRLQKYPARVAISVPRRKFKRAVDRNLVKRRIKESYRLNKSIIYQALGKKDLRIVMIILFLSGEFISFDVLDTVIRNLLRKLAANLP
jgi:ribonuclease P protein component